MQGRPATPPSNNDGTVDLREALDHWLEQTPIVTRSLSVLTIVCFFLGIVVGSHTVATVPLFVFENFEVYRLVISQLFESHLFALIMVLYWLNKVGSRLEQELGSSKVFTIFLQVSISINLVFCAFIVTISQLIGASYMMKLGCQGFFPTIVSLLVIQPPQGPVSIAFVPARIAPQYAPYALIALSTIISGSVPLDLLCALVVGLLFKKLVVSGGGFTGLGGFVLPLFGSSPRATVSAASSSTSMQLPSGTRPVRGASITLAAIKPSRDLLREAAQSRLGQVNGGPGGVSTQSSFPPLHKSSASATTTALYSGVASSTSPSKTSSSSTVEVGVSSSVPAEPQPGQHGYRRRTSSSSSKQAEVNAKNGPTEVGDLSPNPNENDEVAVKFA